MKNGRIPITPSGFKKIKAELGKLKHVDRPYIIKEIETARAHGDLSENAEYHSAKEQQGMIEARIKDLEHKIGRAEVIDPSSLSGDRVMFGATVTIFDLKTEEEDTFQIVGTEEADKEKGTISIDSAIARALISRNQGDEVRVVIPNGYRKLEIVEVEYIGNSGD